MFGNRIINRRSRNAACTVGLEHLRPPVRSAVQLPLRVITPPLAGVPNFGLVADGEGSGGRCSLSLRHPDFGVRRALSPDRAWLAWNF